MRFMAPDPSGGYVWRPDRLLRMSVGASFEHAPLRFTDSSYSGEEFRFLPVLRLGAGSDRFFGYGAAGAGVGLLAVGVPGALADEERIGLDLKLVSGAQMVVWRDLFLEAAASFDLASYGGRRGAAALPGEPTHFRTDRLRFRLIGRRHSYALWNPRARRSSSLISCMSRSRNLSAATIAPETHSQGQPATVRLGPFGGESLSFDSTPVF